MSSNLSLQQLRDQLALYYRADEEKVVQQLLLSAEIAPEIQTTIQEQATVLVQGVRAKRCQQAGLDAFMAEYDLSSEEGVALMCLAEALLRVPDKATADLLIADKIGNADWQEHQGQSQSLFVNAMTWGLMLTGKLLAPLLVSPKNMTNVLKKLLQRAGMPAVRMAVNRMMKILSQQFVMGETIQAAVKRAAENEKRGYRYSYDMLGEAAKTQEDADRYFKAYQEAISAVGKAARSENIFENPGISVKLSALHPRYEEAKSTQVIKELTPRLIDLAVLAKAENIGLSIDAEEADKLELSLDIIEKTLDDGQLTGWCGLGIVVQAYQKRAFYLLDYLAALAAAKKIRLPVRLVKGAYWDSEIKWSQILGLADYPVFTRKIHTDLSYIACAKKMLAHIDVFYPQFATHNAATTALIKTLFPAGRYEFQCLHGMGDPLYDQLIDQYPCRIYAPVGGYRDLLAYLVRRLLENGANTSFINRIVDESIDIETLIMPPQEKIKKFATLRNQYIPVPENIYGDRRRNSRGLDLTNRAEFAAFNQQRQQFLSKQYWVSPFQENIKEMKNARTAVSPTNKKDVLGQIAAASESDCQRALTIADNAFQTWQTISVADRVEKLLHLADQLENALPELIALLNREAGKTWSDAIAEVREAVDFCRYYAAEARDLFSAPQELVGPTGEYNALSLVGRGVVLCISPWNFPLAIFLGQVTAALAAGNTVIAKPSDQTILIAARVIELIYAAGFPRDVVTLLASRGSVIGKIVVPDQRIKAIMFTGSTETARQINQTLAARPGAIIPLIAETGGINAMIVDSTALPEQVVRDVIVSAFGSAGQRCSALRLLCLQEDVAEKLLEMLKGAMQVLKIGQPDLLATDVGPVIDQASYQMLEDHKTHLQKTARLIAEVPLPKDCPEGYYFAPCAYLLENIQQLKEEIFGPILHVITYAEADLPQVIEQINATGYGLTFGIHSRIQHKVAGVISKINAGNCYVNRGMTGAVVGVQPFGGEGLSGTGPKAGGPHYLPRLCLERTISIDTTAAGGNATLLAMEE